MPPHGGLVVKYDRLGWLIAAYAALFLNYPLFVPGCENDATTSLMESRSNHFVLLIVGLQDVYVTSELILYFLSSQQQYVLKHLNFDSKLTIYLKSLSDEVTQNIGLRTV